MKVFSKVALTALVIVLFSGCGGGDSSSDDGVSSVTITAVDGYIKDANLTDSAGQVGTYSSNGKYTFSSTPTYPLTLTGGRLEDTNTSFDINMTCQSGLIISPITTFLENNASLQTQLATALSLSDSIDSFAVDYVDTNNSDLAKLAQLLYMVETNATLNSAFKTRVNGISSSIGLDAIFTLAETDVNATMGDYALGYRVFLNKVKDINSTVVSPSTHETYLESQKISLGLSTVDHDGTTYGAVLSPFTDKVWLDRNLGASQVCNAYNDITCIGDYYQWGREADGHEKGRTSNDVNGTLAKDLNTSANALFITTNANPKDWLVNGVDDNGSLRSANWSNTKGKSICPVGYRVPTIDELTAETTLASTKVTKIEDTNNNFLKLTASGYRPNADGSMYNLGSSGGFWSSSVNGTSSSYVYFYSTNAGDGGTSRALGHPVRCIKD